MSKKLKEMTKAQLKANARNQLFRQIHGYSLLPFILRAERVEAITIEEQAILYNIEELRKKLIAKQFEGSKEVGLNPRRRCCNCNGIARFAVVMFGEKHLMCTKCKTQAEIDNKMNYNGEWLVTDIKEINPYE